MNKLYFAFLFLLCGSNVSLNVLVHVTFKSHKLMMVFYCQICTYSKSITLVEK